MMQIILASQSPRRKELMESIGVSFFTINADIDERIDYDKPPEEEVIRLANEKAEKVRREIQLANTTTQPQYSNLKKNIEQKSAGASVDMKFSKNLIVIGADTIVVLGEEILGKPETEEEARKMLWKLSGTTHKVLTGVAILSDEKDIKWCEVSYVSFKELSEGEIEEYIKTGSPMDKAGAYGIQEKSDKFVTKIRGDFDSIVGLPISKVEKYLKQIIS